MKRKLFGAALLVALAVAAGWNFNQKKNETQMSELALANVEALAQNEGSDWYGCYQGGCVGAMWADCWVYQYGIPVKFCPNAWSA